MLPFLSCSFCPSLSLCSPNKRRKGDKTEDWRAASPPEFSEELQEVTQAMRIRAKGKAPMILPREEQINGLVRICGALQASVHALYIYVPYTCP